MTQRPRASLRRVLDDLGHTLLDLVHDLGPYKGTTTRALYHTDGKSLRYSTLVAPDSLLDGKVVTATTTWKRKSR